MTVSKKRDYTDLTFPAAVREPESCRALAAEDELVRKRYQKLRDLTEIITQSLTE